MFCAIKLLLYWCGQRYSFHARVALQCTVYAPHSWRCMVPVKHHTSEAKSHCDTREDDLCDSRNRRTNCFEIRFHSENSAGRRRNISWLFFLVPWDIEQHWEAICLRRWLCWYGIYIPEKAKLHFLFMWWSVWFVYLVGSSCSELALIGLQNIAHF